MPENQLFEILKGQFFIIAGPCVAESEEICLSTASFLKDLCKELSIPLVFKASFKKANRTSIHSFSGNDVERSLQMLLKVKEAYQLPILTDIHETGDVAMLESVADILQIPAFLCRQTDLILAAAHTGKIVNIKKGQFASAEIMRYAAEKVLSTGNKAVMLTERGSFFGYEDLVVDMRNIPMMKAANLPVVYDATHSVQQPGKAGGASGGQKPMILPLANAAIAAGADGLFLECHPEPSKGLSDAATMLSFGEAENLIRRTFHLHSFLKKN